VWRLGDDHAVVRPVDLRAQAMDRTRFAGITNGRDAVQRRSFHHAQPGLVQDRRTATDAEFKRTVARSRRSSAMSEARSDPVFGFAWLLANDGEKKGLQRICVGGLSTTAGEGGVPGASYLGRLIFGRAVR